MDIRHTALIAITAFLIGFSTLALATLPEEDKEHCDGDFCASTLQELYMIREYETRF